MPSGSITVTPGKQFVLVPAEKVSLQKLNELGQPVGRVDEGAITIRELDPSIGVVLNSVRGRNLFCNGAFQMWANTNLTGLITGGLTHEYGSAARWVTANDANRAITLQNFPTGSTEVPHGIYFLRWIQSANVANNPSYIGQRIEDVRRFSGQPMAFSVYVRATANITVTPKLRQVFGGVKRTMQTTIGSLGSASGVYTDGARGFRASEVGAGIVVSGPGPFGPITSTINTVSNPGSIIIDNTSGGTAAGLTAVITSPAGSASVVTAGTAVALVANTWTRIVEPFTVPDVTGKTIPDAAVNSFTEFRVEMPLSTTFQIDFANAQLEVGTDATTFEPRLLPEDLIYSRFYLEGQIIGLSNDITVWKPFITLEDKRVRPTLQFAILGGGTGAKVELRETDSFVTQGANNSAISTGVVVADSEIRD